MTLTKEMLDTEYAQWFRGCKNPQLAKLELLKLFSQEPDESRTWTEQDIYE